MGGGWRDCWGNSGVQRVNYDTRCHGEMILVVCGPRLLASMWVRFTVWGNRLQAPQVPEVDLQGSFRQKPYQPQPTARNRSRSASPPCADSGTPLFTLPESIRGNEHSYICCMCRHKIMSWKSRRRSYVKLSHLTICLSSVPVILLSSRRDAG